MSRQINRIVACAHFRNRWFLERGRQIPPKSAISLRLLRRKTSRVDVSEDPISPHEQELAMKPESIHGSRSPMAVAALVLFEGAYASAATLWANVDAAIYAIKPRRQTG
jgi:hypothetical protein